MIQREYFTVKNLASNIVVAIVFATLLIMLYAAPLAADNNQMDLSSESKDYVQLIIASEMNDIAHPKLGLFAQLKTLID